MLTLALLINHLVQVAWNVFKGGTPKDENTKAFNPDIKPLPSPQSVDTPVLPTQSITVRDNQSGTSRNSSRVAVCESVVVQTQAAVTSRPSSRPPPLLLVKSTTTAAHLDNQAPVQSVTCTPTPALLDNQAPVQSVTCTPTAAHLDNQAPVQSVTCTPTAAPLDIQAPLQSVTCTPTAAHLDNQAPVQSVTCTPAPAHLDNQAPVQSVTCTPAPVHLDNQVESTKEDIHESSSESGGKSSDESMASVKDVEEMLSELSLQGQPGVRPRSARGRAKVTSRSNTSQGQTKVTSRPGRGRSAARSGSPEVGFRSPQGHIRNAPRASRGRSKVMSRSDEGHPRDRPSSFVDKQRQVKSRPRRGQDRPPSPDDWTPVKPKPRRGRGAASSVSEKPTQRAASPPPPPPTTSDTNRDPSITLEMRRTNKFPFLLHATTVEHVRGSNVMFVMRGLPGSGKSTVVKLLTERYPDAVCCSADDHFLQPDGTYSFKVEGLTAAHEACQSKARAACERATPVVIIDNTNVRTWEMQNYIKMASQYSYTTVTVEPRTAWRMNARELAARNKHGVPEDVIRRKVQSYDTGIPLYYGWFLNRDHSTRIMEAGEAFFGMTLRACPRFSTVMNQINDTQEETTMSTVYWREGSSSDLLHCTAFFANRGRALTATAYHNQPHVTEAMGRTFTLEVVGFVFTNKTAGVRIRISPKLMPLWGKDDNEGQPGGGAAAFRSDSANWRKRGGRVTDNGASYSNAAGYSTAACGSSETSRFRPVVGEGSRAHLTLGYTKASKAVQAGFDLQEVVQYETRARRDEDGAGTKHVDGAAIRCYNNAFWVVYLDEPISIQTLFSGRY